MNHTTENGGAPFGSGPAATIASGTTGLSEEDRSAFLERMCGNDVELRREVEMLLREQSGGTVQTAMLRGAAGLAAFSLPEEVLPIELERYRLEARIGEGSFGVVYRAMQKAPVRRQVAVKVLHPGLNSVQVLKRFEIESQTLAKLQHQHIARLHDAGYMPDGRPFFAMEFIDGVSITQYCDQHHLDIRKRLALFMQVCHAVQHVHQKGIIHRDIKPTNILVVEEEGQPVPKVLDFGIAKATQGELTELTMHTQMQQFMGTPDYMSPEQAQLSALDVDTRSDIYSLGVVLYELLTGKRPFDAKVLLNKGIDELRRAIREEEPPRPSACLRKLPLDELKDAAEKRDSEAARLPRALQGDLDSIITKCLEKDRARRYQTANDLARDIERFLDNEPVEARPASAAYRLRKFIRRHRATAAALVAVLSAAGCATGFYLHGIHAEQQKTSAALKIAEERGGELQHALYVSQMNRAGQSSNEISGIASVRDLIEPWARVQPDLRGWEWYYLNAVSHMESMSVSTAAGALWGGSWSPDGTKVATACSDLTVRIIDAATGKQLLVLNRHGRKIGQLVWSPDGTRIAGCANDSTARVWDANTGIQLFGLTGHRGQLSCVSWRPDGRELITSAGDDTIRTWDARDGKPLEVVPAFACRIAAWSPDQTRLAYSDAEGGVAVFDAGVLENHVLDPVMTTALQNSVIRSMDWSPDGHRIATANDRGQVAVFDAQSGKQVWSARNHIGQADSVRFSPDGTLIASAGSGDYTIRILDASNGAEKTMLRGNRGPVFQVEWKPDGSMLVSGSLDSGLMFWRLDRRQPVVTLTGHSAALSTLSWQPDGNHLVSVSGDNTVREWDVVRKTEVSNRLVNYKGASSAAVSPDGSRLALACPDSLVKVWDLALGKQVAELSGHTSAVLQVAWNPKDADLLASRDHDSNVKVWSISRKKELRTLHGDASGATTMAWSPDGTKIAVGFGWYMAQVWDVRTWNVISRYDGQWGGAVDLEWSPDGTRIATVGREAVIRIWQADSGKTIRQLRGHAGAVGAISWSPDGNRLASAGDDQKLRLWDTGTGEELMALNVEKRLRMLAWSPDGKRIASSNDSGAIVIFDASDGYLDLTTSVSIPVPASAPSTK